MKKSNLDRNIALIVLLAVLFLGILIGRASACESYEDCMKKSRKAWNPFTAKAYSDTALAYAAGDIAKTIKERK